MKCFWLLLYFEGVSWECCLYFIDVMCVLGGVYLMVFYLLINEVYLCVIVLIVVLVVMGM